MKYLPTKTCTFKRRGNTWKKGRTMIRICDSGLRCHVNIPLSVKEIFLVFNVKKGGPDAFDITSFGNIIGVRATLYEEFQLFLRRYHNLGYRCFHFEYDE
jgi:hypothetical protein